MSDALSALDMEVTTEEWFEYSGDPYHFRVEVLLRDRGITEEEITALEAVVQNTKNVRSKLDKITIGLAQETAVPTIAVQALFSEITTIHPYEVPDYVHHGAVPAFASVLQSVETVIIYPQGS